MSRHRSNGNNSSTRNTVIATTTSASAASTNTVPVTNGLIGVLSRQQCELLLAKCELVQLQFGAVLCEPDTPFRQVYFPLTGIISLVSTLAGHKPLEMGLIGSEGMLGATVVLGVNTVPMRAVVQGAGTALRMSAAQWRRELVGSPTLKGIVKRYLYVLMAQLSQSTSCMCFHTIEQRLIRWLLMTHDRAHADHFYLTHEFLADMLGVRRSGITNVASALQRKKLIQYTRGDIHIIDRAGLEALVCECYQVLVDDYVRLI